MTLFSLGFGNDVDFPFLKKMALQNKGFARKIYADSDAAIQLQGYVTCSCCRKVNEMMKVLASEPLKESLYCVLNRKQFKQMFV